MLDRTRVIAGFLEVVRHVRFDHTRMRAIGRLEPFAESLVQAQAARADTRSKVRFHRGTR